MARPKKVIDEELLGKLASIQCTYEEMSLILEVSVDTLERRYAGFIMQKKEGGKTQIRRGLFQLALSGNLGALIWLSKNHLGMSDRAEQKIEHKGAVDVTYAAQWGNKSEPTDDAKDD